MLQTIAAVVYSAHGSRIKIPLRVQVSLSVGEIALSFLLAKICRAGSAALRGPGPAPGPPADAKPPSLRHRLAALGGPYLCFMEGHKSGTSRKN